MAVWMVRAGKYGERESYALENNAAVIGWDELPNMSEIESFEDMKVFHASLLLSMGESPVYVKEQLGHHSIQITVDIYGHWIKTKPNAGVNRLDDITPNRTPYAPTENQKAVTS